MGAERIIKRDCPSCGVSISLGARTLNKKIRCPQCRHLVVVEDAAPVELKAEEAPAVVAVKTPEISESVEQTEAPEVVAEPVEPAKAKPSLPPMPEYPVLDASERKVLFDIIGSVEKSPDRTHFVFIKDLGVASGTYKVAPDNRQPLAELKAILNREPAAVEGPKTSAPKRSVVRVEEGSPAKTAAKGASMETQTVTESGESLEEIREMFRRNLASRRI